VNRCRAPWAGSVAHGLSEPCREAVVGSGWAGRVCVACARPRSFRPSGHRFKEIPFPFSRVISIESNFENSYLFEYLSKKS
jgi:hypothetical protein